MFAGLLILASHTAACQQPNWIATWTASPEAADPDPDDALLNLDDQTVRERARISLGGQHIRIVLTNEYGKAPLLIGRVSLGIARSKTEVVAGSLRSVTFNGTGTVTIAGGASVLSDPIDLPVKSNTELAVSLYLPQKVTSVTWHSLAMKDAVISRHGDHAQEILMETDKVSSSSVFLKQVLISNEAHGGVIVAFGDSIVDGDESTPEADNGWTGDLARRLLAKRHGQALAVVNEGIAGNRLLRDGPLANLGVSGLSRFERDALNVPGVTTVVLLEGTNDIGFPDATLRDFRLAPATDTPTANDIINGYKQLIARAHARQVRIIGCTIMPTGEATIANYHTEAKEVTRRAVNDWIRASRAFDGVIDFDAAMRDPGRPDRLNPSLASADHIHPNGVGYQKMADTIDLSLLN